MNRRQLLAAGAAGLTGAVARAMSLPSDPKGSESPAPWPGSRKISFRNLGPETIGSVRCEIVETIRGPMSVMYKVKTVKANVLCTVLVIGQGVV